MSGWIGVDLDGTLAHYEGWNGLIGEPIPEMLQRVRSWLSCGLEVRIVTARVSDQAGAVERELQRDAIRAWCRKYLGEELTVTNEKDFGMTVLFDDRCVAVEKNTGRLLSPDPVDAMLNPKPAP